MKKEIIEITEEIQINEDTILEIGDKIQILKEGRGHGYLMAEIGSGQKRYSTEIALVGAGSQVAIGIQGFENFNQVIYMDLDELNMIINF